MAAGPLHGNGTHVLEANAHLFLDDEDSDNSDEESDEGGSSEEEGSDQDDERGGAGPSANGHG